MWDFSEGPEFFRYFWNAAIRLDPSARALDPATRFTICRPDALQKAFETAGPTDIRVAPLDVETPLMTYWMT